jgi:hypothetical protein
MEDILLLAKMEKALPFGEKNKGWAVHFLAAFL